LVAVAPTDEPETDAARLARLRGGLPDELQLLGDLGDLLRDLRAAATEQERHLDLQVGWDRVQHLLAEGTPPDPG